MSSYLRKSRSVPTLAVVLLFSPSCSEPETEEGCPSGKCDEAGARILETCFVSQSFDAPGIESAYKFTADGENLAMPTLGRIEVREDADSRLTLLAGEHTFTDVSREEGVTEFDDIAYRDYVVQAPEGFEGPLMLRIFDENSVGMLVKNANDRPSPFVELDCNPGNAPHSLAKDPICEGAQEDDAGRCRGSDGRFVERRCCEHVEPELAATDSSFACTIVTYDDSSFFDTSVGTPYLHTLDGEILTEPGHWEVEYHVSDFSDHPDGLRFDHGGSRFNGANDTFDFLGDRAVEVGARSRTIKQWRFARGGSDSFVEVSIFSDSGMGLMHHSVDDEPAVQLDCRTTFVAPEQLF